MRADRPFTLEMPLSTPRLFYTATAVEGWFPKDAESMGREDQPLLDFSSE